LLAGLQQEEVLPAMFLLRSRCFVSHLQRADQGSALAPSTWRCGKKVYLAENRRKYDFLPQWSQGWDYLLLQVEASFATAGRFRRRSRARV